MDSRNLLKQIEEFENTEEGYGYSLRLDLSEIILRHLNTIDMTQANLAEKAKTSQKMVTHIVHAASNCTFETAARLLFALGVKAKLVEVHPGQPSGFKEANNVPASVSTTSCIVNVGQPYPVGHMETLSDYHEFASQGT